MYGASNPWSCVVSRRIARQHEGSTLQQEGAKVVPRPSFQITMVLGAKSMLLDRPSVEPYLDAVSSLKSCRFEHSHSPQRTAEIPRISL